MIRSISKADNNYNIQLYSGKVSQTLGFVEQKLVSLADFFVTSSYESFRFATNASLKEHRKFIKNIILKNEDKDFIETELALMTYLKDHHPLLKTAMRVGAFIAGIGFGVAAIITLIPMLMFRAALQPFKVDFIYLTPTQTAPIKIDRPVSFYSLNAALSRFEIMNTVNGLRPSIERIDQILDHVLKGDDRPDIINMQEAFHDTLILNRIAKKLQEAGYYVVYASKPRLGVLSSGLLLASKYPIKDFAFMPYDIPPNAMHINYLVNKGVLTVAIDLGEGKTIINATTHALCGIPAKNDIDKTAIYRKHHRDARQFIAQFAHKNKSKERYHIIYSGDFNTHLLKRKHQKTGSQYDLDADPNDEVGNEISALFESSNYPAFIPLNGAKTGKQLGVFVTNEIGKTKFRGGTALEKHSISFKHSTQLFQKPGFKLAREHGVFDHFFYASNYPSNGLPIKYKFSAEAPLMTKKGLVLSDHVGIRLSLNFAT